MEKQNSTHFSFSSCGRDLSRDEDDGLLKIRVESQVLTSRILREKKLNFKGGDRNYGLTVRLTGGGGKKLVKSFEFLEFIDSLKELKRQPKFVFLKFFWTWTTLQFYLSFKIKWVY